MSKPVSNLLTGIETALTGALKLREASLVIFRRGALVEYKTDLLSTPLTSTMEGRFRSWQIGPYDGHHCHLDLASINSVWFDAEPVSCQGGRLNYTVWFLAGEDCGNPYRANGAFSVTLNSPYAVAGPAREDVIEPVYSLYEALQHLPWVSASEGFRDARPAGGERHIPGLEAQVAE